MTVLGRHIETVQPAAAPASRPGEEERRLSGGGEEAKSFKQSVTVTSEACLCLTSGGCTSETFWHPWKEIGGNAEKRPKLIDNWKIGDTD